MVNVTAIRVIFLVSAILLIVVACLHHPGAAVLAILATIGFFLALTLDPEELE